MQTTVFANSDTSSNASNSRRSSRYGSLSSSISIHPFASSTTSLPTISSIGSFRDNFVFAYDVVKDAIATRKGLAQAQSDIACARLEVELSEVNTKIEEYNQHVEHFFVLLSPKIQDLKAFIQNITANLDNINKYPRQDAKQKLLEMFKKHLKSVWAEFGTMHVD